jgi:hypothetical protein
MDNKLEKITALEIGMDFITDQDIFDFIQANQEIEDLEDLKNELKEYFEDFVNEEVTYYYSAIEYLKENDPSLKNSFNLALEQGYTLDNIDSEVLASLLKTQKNQKEFEEFLESDAVEEIFNLFYKK